MPKARKPAPKRKAKGKGKARGKPATGGAQAKRRAPQHARGGFFAPADEMATRIGRPSYKPTDQDRRYVRTMSGFGLSFEEMAKVMRIDRNTLTKYFREDIDEGRIEAMAQVSGALFKKAIDPKGASASVRAAEIWLKRDARWLEARRPKDEDDEAGDNELVIKGGLPERELKEVMTAEEEAAAAAKAADASAPPAPDKPAE